MKPEEIVAAPYSSIKNETVKDIVVDNVDISVEAVHKKRAKEFDQDETIVLIIEDNVEVRNYIREQLQTQYRIAEAGDGEEGIDTAFETVPDLIVCDVMMLKKNGYQVCQILKKDERTSHIPIVLLTAKAATEEKIEGLETGADDYLYKPFDTKELRIRVKNLINIRRKLRKRFSTKLILRPSEIVVSATDQRFLERALAIVERNMDNEDFSVQKFSRSVGFSRPQLHRKLKALTNQAANEFILSICLQRAGELLKQNAGTVAEIAYQVGFNDPAYFTRAFRKYFGKPPSEFSGINHQPFK